MAMTMIAIARAAGDGASLPVRTIVDITHSLPTDAGPVGSCSRPRTRTPVRYNMDMREEDVRATDIGMVPLGYGRFVRADEIVAVLPIEDGRGPRRRTHVHVAGLAAPIVASRSEEAILADMKTARGSALRGTRSDDRRNRPAPAAPHRRSRLVFGARRD
jgi:hypothetical protein